MAAVPAGVATGLGSLDAAGDAGTDSRGDAIGVPSGLLPGVDTGDGYAASPEATAAVSPQASPANSLWDTPRSTSGATPEPTPAPSPVHTLLVFPPNNAAPVYGPALVPAASGPTGGAPVLSPTGQPDVLQPAVGSPYLQPVDAPFVQPLSAINSIFKPVYGPWTVPVLSRPAAGSPSVNDLGQPDVLLPSAGHPAAQPASGPFVAPDMAAIRFFGFYPVDPKGPALAIQGTGAGPVKVPSSGASPRVLADTTPGLATLIVGSSKTPAVVPLMSPERGNIPVVIAADMPGVFGTSISDAMVPGVAVHLLPEDNWDSPGVAASPPPAFEAGRFSPFDPKRPAVSVAIVGSPLGPVRAPSSGKSPRVISGAAPAAAVLLSGATVPEVVPLMSPERGHVPVVIAADMPGVFSSGLGVDTPGIAAQLFPAAEWDTPAVVAVPPPSLRDSQISPFDPKAPAIAIMGTGDLAIKVPSSGAWPRVLASTAPGTTVWTPPGAAPAVVPHMSPERGHVPGIAARLFPAADWDTPAVVVAFPALNDKRDPPPLPPLQCFPPDVTYDNKSH
eukprot:gene5439-5446_t